MESIKRTLIGTRKFNDSLTGRAFIIAYYLTEKKAECGKIYGVSLNKEQEEGTQDANSFDAFITSDKSHAGRIISTLIDGQVTPACALEVIDYLYDITL